MKQYSENEKNRLLSFPIEGVLAACGRRTDHKGYMYYSPFREEDSPSFHIDIRTNRWYDFGSAEGGGVIDLVCRLKECQKKDALDILSSFDTNFAHIDLQKPDCRKTVQAAAVQILSVSDTITRYSLLEYAIGERKIPGDILSRYCKEISYRIESRRDTLFYAIGFPNNSGGYVLRSSRTKICSSSDITTLDRKGNVSMSPSSRKVLVFEGFFDMLSWRAMFGGKSLGCDICVLNSVSNWKRSLDYLSQHGKVCLCLDNDEAGKRSVTEIAGSIKRLNVNLEVWDMSESYKFYKDVAQMWEAIPSSREERHYINP